MTRVAALIALAIVLATVLTGCTQRETRDQYEKKIGRIYTLRAQTLERLATERDDATYLAEAQLAIEEAADELDRLTPPRDVERAHQRYVSSLRGMAAVIDRLASCARLQKTSAGDADSCRRAIDTEQLDQVENDFSEAETIYREEGYDLPDVKEQ